MKKNNPKSALIRQNIKEALIREELALPLYASHIEQTLFWSGLPETKQKKIIASLKILEADSAGHVILLKKVEKIYLNSLK